MIAASAALQTFTAQGRRLLDYESDALAAEKRRLDPDRLSKQTLLIQTRSRHRQVLALTQAKAFLTTSGHGGPEIWANEGYRPSTRRWPRSSPRSSDSAAAVHDRFLGG